MISACSSYTLCISVGSNRVSDANEGRDDGHTRFHRSFTIPSTPNTTLSFPRPGTSTSSTHVSGTTLAHSSCARHRPSRSQGPADGSRGASYTHNRPSELCDTHRQHGNESGSFGFGPSFSLIEVILLGPAGSVGVAGSTFSFSFFAFGGADAWFSSPSAAALRFLGDLLSDLRGDP